MEMKWIPDSVANKFEIYNYHHAIEIIANAFPAEWKDIIDTLSAFQIEVRDLAQSGGAETNIPGKIDAVLYPRKWRNVQIKGDLNISFYERIVDRKQYADFPTRESSVPGFLSGQQVDYLKGRVAVYLEWNKKDLAFDKTLTDIRMLYDCGIISAAVLITRSGDLNDAFKEIEDEDGKPVARKYGSSSTWIGKLLPRMDAHLSGGCPVLILGIKKNCIEGY